MIAFSPDPEWVSIKEYAAIYRVHRNTVTKWAESGLLICWRVQHTVRVKNAPPDQTSTLSRKACKGPIAPIHAQRGTS